MVSQKQRRKIKGSISRSKFKKGSADKRIICYNDAPSSPAVGRAQEIIDNLPLITPKFLKLFSRSHVTHGFWLGLPREFCVKYLPDRDETIILVVAKEEKEHHANYLAGKGGLSGGWRGFSLSHELAEGDVGVFQLIDRCKFKVHIVRASAFADSREQSKGGNHKPKESKLITLDNTLDTFKGVKTFDDFKIQVNGLILDTEMHKYYQLCCSQKRLLHENLKGLNGKLVSGMISDMINISDTIRAGKASMGLGDLERHDKKLNAYEDLGMVVGFLRARIHKLMNLSRELEEKLESKRNEADDLIRQLETRLLAVKKVKSNLDVDMKNRNDNLFMKIAGKPWRRSSFVLFMHTVFWVSIFVFGRLLFIPGF